MEDAASFNDRYRDLETAFDTMHCGVFARDAAGAIVYVNDRMLSWLAYTREEVLGRSLEGFVPVELRDLVQADMKATEAGDLRVRIVAVQRKDCTTFPVLVIPQRSEDGAGGFTGTFSVVVDLGAVLTAKQVGESTQHDVRSTLSRIAIELQSISMTPGPLAGAPVALDHPGLGDLSGREKEVVWLLVAGDRVPAISEQLHISPHTVRNHLKSVFRKVGVRTQSELIQRVRALSQPAGESEDTSAAPSGETPPSGA